MKTAVLSVCTKNILNYKKTAHFPRERSTTSFSSHPVSAPPSYQSLVGKAKSLVGIANAKAFNVGISKKKLFEVTELHVTPRIRANPSCTKATKIRHQTSHPLALDFHLAHSSFELCRSSSRSVPRLGVRFGSLRPTFVIYDYNINRNVYIYICI